MKSNFSIHSKHIHLWRVFLPEFQGKTEELFALLTSDEKARAERFHFPLHRMRYIITRGILRHVLSGYTSMDPAKIAFHYGPRGKPYLSNVSIDLQFNVSHSHDYAVFGLTINHEIGVDIELIEDEYKDAVAKRFFSEAEYLALTQLPEKERNTAFYQLWAGKEALIKAVGEGLYVPLDQFSLVVDQPIQTVLFSYENRVRNFYVKNFTVDASYQSAVATEQSVANILYWQWTLNGPQPWI